MKIERASLYLIPLRLREPFVSSRGTAYERQILLLKLEGGGLTGWSECVAGVVPGYSRETTEGAWRSLAEELLPAIVGASHEDPAAVLESVGEAPGQPMARGAVEMAAWDLWAKRRGIPLHEAIGGTGRLVPAGVSLGLEDEDALLRRIERHAREGYRRVKLKIEPRRDIDVLSRVRDYFPEVPLAADANGAYTLSDRTLLRELDDLSLEMLEQPLGAEAFDDHAELQSVLRTPICLDESIRSAADADRALELGACRIVNVKPGRVGGLTEARAIHDLCRGRGIPVLCGGMLESGVGRAHNVALATLPGFTLPGDLSASRRYWDQDLVTPEWELEGGALVPLDRPGIGVEPDAERIRELTARYETIG